MSINPSKKQQLRFFTKFMDADATNNKVSEIKSEQDISPKKYDKDYCKNRYGKVDRSIVVIDQINLDMSYGSTSTMDSIHSNDIQEVFITMKIDSIDDLLRLIDKYPIISNVKYNINMKSIHNIKEDLVKLNNMIGMTSLKNNIIDQILYFAQGLHTFAVETDGDFLHTVIYGPPGTGKTEVAKIMGSIYSKLGILKKNVFKKASRSDLIAGYLGQTAIKTRELITSCLGGVLFIDEAYSLGNEEKRDSFAKEALDTLCEALSEHKHELMVIIAGYEEELRSCFFNFNKGLESRFTWRFKTQNYTPDEMKLILEKKITENKWNYKPISVKWFEKNIDYFKYFGRDMETLFSKMKIAHGRRVFCLPESEKKMITLEDLEGGFKKYLENDDIKKRKEQSEFKQFLQNTLYS